jgi:uncharacterized protein
VEIEFDPDKDVINLGKHGISLRRAAEMDIRAALRDPRFEEERYRLYGLIDDLWYCLAATYRGKTTRAISLRRAHQKEIDAHVES